MYSCGKPSHAVERLALLFDRIREALIGFEERSVVPMLGDRNPTARPGIVLNSSRYSFAPAAREGKFTMHLPNQRVARGAHWNGRYSFGAPGNEPDLPEDDAGVGGGSSAWRCRRDHVTRDTHTAAPSARLECGDCNLLLDDIHAVFRCDPKRTMTYALPRSPSEIARSGCLMAGDHGRRGAPCPRAVRDGREDLCAVPPARDSPVWTDLGRGGGERGFIAISLGERFSTDRRMRWAARLKLPHSLFFRPSSFEVCPTLSPSFESEMWRSDSGYLEGSSA